MLKDKGERLTTLVLAWETPILKHIGIGKRFCGKRFGKADGGNNGLGETDLVERFLEKKNKKRFRE